MNLQGLGLGLAIKRFLAQQVQVQYVGTAEHRFHSVLLPLVT